MPVEATWVQTALMTTGQFEASGDPLGAVAGDFDGQGISLGALQWNIGQGSLQPMVKNVGRDQVVATMPQIGAELWTACNSGKERGLEIVRGWHSEGKLRTAVKQELEAFTRSAPFVAEQIAKVNDVAGNAKSTAERWNRDSGKPEPSLHEFCWFFDLLTQNGSLNGVTPAMVKSFIDDGRKGRAVDRICDWLQARPTTQAGSRDSGKNAELWRTGVPDSRVTLFVASFLRSLAAKPKWQADVMNRKGTVAVGVGMVHGKKFDLGAILGGGSSFPVSLLAEDERATVVKVNDRSDNLLWLYALGRRHALGSLEAITELRRLGLVEDREIPLSRATLDAIPVMPVG